MCCGGVHKVFFTKHRVAALFGRERSPSGACLHCSLADVEQDKLSTTSHGKAGFGI